MLLRCGCRLVVWLWWWELFLPMLDDLVIIDCGFDLAQDLSPLLVSRWPH